MTILEAVILGLIQGATEFIPVSSSGHLVLVPWLLGWNTPGLTFTVVTHLGTAIGVIVFFREEWLTMIKGLWQWLQTGEANPDAGLLGLIMLGVLPVGLIGVTFRPAIGRLFELPFVAAIMLIITAGLLFFSERLGTMDRDMQNMTWLDSLFIGVMQALAIMPGLSRSGSTIAAGRLRNVNREGAARFSFLLSMPVILGAGLAQIIDLIRVGSSTIDMGVLVAGFGAALLSTYFVIKWLLSFLKTRSTVVFSVYCLSVSILSLAVWWYRTL